MTRGIIAGQVKALSMIVAIEGLIPSGTMNDRRLSPSRTQPAATPLNPQIYDSERRPKDQPAAADQPPDPAAAAPPEPVAPRVPEPPLAHHADQLNPFVIPQPLNRVPSATHNFFDVALDATGPLKLPYSVKSGFARSR